MPGASWTIEIDWNNDGDWSDTGEDVTARVLNRPGIVMERGRDQVRALAPPMAGRGEFALDNTSGDYSPANTGSPLYGNLLPGRAVRVRSTTIVGGTVWRGTLDDLPQEPFAAGGGRVRAPALGTLAKLKGVAVWTELHSNTQTSDAFAAVCAAAGLAASEYSALDTGQTTLTHWWCAGDDAFAMLVKILAAEGPGAAIYEQGDGTIRFHSRHYRLLTSRCTTAQATFGDGATEPKHSPPFAYQPNLKNVVNGAALETRVLTLAGAATDLQTFTLDPAVTLYPSESVDIPIQLSAVADWESTPGNMETPDLTFEGASGAYSTTADRLSGQAFTLTVTSAATFPITFSAVTIRGYASTTTTVPVANTVDTSASQARYGARSLPSGWTPWPYIDAATARAFCNAIVTSYQEPRATVAVTVKGANTTRLTQMLSREISDRIAVDESQTGFSGDVYIERIRHDIREGGRFHTTTFGCEEAGPHGDWYVVGTSLVGTGRAGF